MRLQDYPDRFSEQGNIAERSRLVFGRFSVRISIGTPGVVNFTCYFPSKHQGQFPKSTEIKTRPLPSKFLSNSLFAKDPEGGGENRNAVK
jgi:hypothetical protein